MSTVKVQELHEREVARLKAVVEKRQNKLAAAKHQLRKAQERLERARD